MQQIWTEFDISAYGATMVNLGGGLGIDYLDPKGNAIPDFQRFFNLIHEKLQLPEGVSRHFELGRSLVGQCGTLITRVLYVKQGIGKQHVIVDAGMTELIRPALYGAIHKIENISSQEGSQCYDVVGPICESSDCFGHQIELPVTLRGDLIKIYSCGAYAESMAMNYNLRGKIGVAYLEAGKLSNFGAGLVVQRGISSDGQSADYFISSFTASSIC